MIVRRAKKKIFFCLSILLAILLCELSAYLCLILFNLAPQDGTIDAYTGHTDIVRKQGTLTRVTGSIDNSIAHPYFGHVTGKSVTLREPVNNHGFISEYDYPYHRKNDEFVIGIFGGSVANSFAKEMRYRGFEFKRLLKKKVKALKDKKIILLNMAQGAAKQPQQFMILSFFLEMFDLVINIEGQNEALLYPSTRFPVEFPYYATYLFSDSRRDKMLVGENEFLKFFVVRAVRLFQRFHYYLEVMFSTLYGWQSVRGCLLKLIGTETCFIKTMMRKTFMIRTCRQRSSWDSL